MTPGKSPERFRRFPEFLLMLTVSIPTVWGGLRLIEKLEIKQCAEAVFMAGTLRGFPQTIALISLALLIFGVARHALMHLFPMWAHWAGVKLNCDRQWHERWGGIVAIVLVGVMTTLWIASFSQFCLAHDAITYRSWAWQPFVSARWNQVREIDLACRRDSKNSTELSYNLILENGGTLDISADREALEQAYPNIRDAL